MFLPPPAGPSLLCALSGLVEPSAALRPPTSTRASPPRAPRSSMPRSTTQAMRTQASLIKETEFDRLPAVIVRAVSADRARSQPQQITAPHTPTGSFPPRSRPSQSRSKSRTRSKAVSPSLDEPACCCWAEGVAAVPVAGGRSSGGSIDSESTTAGRPTRARRATFDPLHDEDDELSPDEDIKECYFDQAVLSADPDEDDEEVLAPGAIDLRSSTESAALSLSRQSTRSSLSRTPLFASDDEFEYSDSDEEDEMDSPGPTTPSSLASSFAVSPATPRTFAREQVTSDPLSSPSSGSLSSPPVLSFARRAGGKNNSGGWLPWDSGRQPTAGTATATSLEALPQRRVSLSSLSPIPSPSPAQTQAAPSKVSGASLLTQSLKSLHTRLPNISLPSNLSQSIGGALAGLARTTMSRELEGLSAGAVDEVPWVNVGGGNGGAMGSAGRRSGEIAWLREVEERERRRELIDAERRRSFGGAIDAEEVDARTAAGVQMDSLAKALPQPAPRPTAPKPKPTFPLLPIAENLLPSAPEPVAPQVPQHRIISNQRHLLMLSLEIAMMRADKIRSPLRPRAVVVRTGAPKPGGSPLRRQRAVAAF